MKNRFVDYWKEVLKYFKMRMEKDMDIKEIAYIEKENDADTIRAKELYQKLDFKGKMEHLWEYHKNKFYTVIFFIVLAVIAYLLSPEPSPEANLRIKFVNTYVEGLMDETNIIETDYEAYLGENNTCEMAFAYTKLDPNNETQGGQNMESMMIEVATCNLEVFIFDEFAMNKLCPTGYLVDVNTCLEPEIVEKVKDRLVYHEDLEGNVVPMAIDITDTKYVKDMGIQGEKIFLSFVVNSPNPEVAKEFVTYIISQEM